MGYINIKKKCHIRIKKRCLKEGVFPQIYWKSRKGEHGSFKMAFDRQNGKKYGALTVRLVWHELTHRDIDGFEDKHLTLY